MPRFHFDIIEPARCVADPDGIDLSDAAAARAMAQRFARDLIAEEVRATGTVPLDLALDVRDEDGTVMHHMAFAQAISIRSDSA